MPSVSSEQKHAQAAEAAAIDHLSSGIREDLARFDEADKDRDRKLDFSEFRSVVEEQVVRLPYKAAPLPYKAVHLPYKAARLPYKAVRLPIGRREMDQEAAEGEVC